MVPEHWILVVLDVQEPIPGGARLPDPGSAECRKAKSQQCRITASQWCQMSESQTLAVPEYRVPVVPGIREPNPCSAGYWTAKPCLCRSAGSWQHIRARNPGSAGVPDPGAARHHQAKPRRRRSPPHSQSVGERITRGAAFFLPARIPG